jgi:hypothetical protein
MMPRSKPDFHVISKKSPQKTVSIICTSQTELFRVLTAKYREHSSERLYLSDREFSFVLKNDKDRGRQ